MTHLTHQGYIAEVELDAEENLLHGRVVNVRDVIDFFAESVEELQAEFANSVREYLRVCEERKIEPETHYSGSFQVRLEPADHRAVAAAAKIEGESMNRWVAETLKTAARRVLEKEPA